MSEQTAESLATLDLALKIQVVVGDHRPDQLSAEALVVALSLVVLHRLGEHISGETTLKKSQLAMALQ